MALNSLAWQGPTRSTIKDRASRTCPIHIPGGWRDGRGFPFSHSMLIQDKVAALIDIGCGFERLERIREKYCLHLVLNSHTHPGHSAGNWLLEGMSLFVPQEGFDISGQPLKVSERFTEPEQLAQEWRGYVREMIGFQGTHPPHACQDARLFRLSAVELGQSIRLDMPETITASSNPG